ncbi:MAG TPA: PDZ domain-containing protein [Candidatus Eisenbacteria bacterium]|nr:PDZ domain-containing protein [Candidatus Eisenbacteria bacterium]
MNTKVARWPLLGLAAGSLCLALSAAPAVAHPHEEDDAHSTPPRVRVDRGHSGEEAQVQGGYLGVRVQDIDPELKQARDLPSTEGALVNRVEDESPAEKAGLKRGDVIVRLDGEEIEDSAELIREMREKKPGATIQIAAVRAGERKNFEVTLGTRPPQRYGDVTRWHVRELDDLPERMERIRVGRDEVRRQLDDLEREVQSLQEEVRELREELRARNESRED